MYEADKTPKTDPVGYLLELIENDPGRVQKIIDSLQAERLADMHRTQVRDSRSVARRGR